MPPISAVITPIADGLDRDRRQIEADDCNDSASHYRRHQALHPADPSCHDARAIMTPAATMPPALIDAYVWPVSGIAAGRNDDRD